jgi:hypothetical protein
MRLNEETAKLDPFGRCPECGVNWDAGDVFDALRSQAWCDNKSDEELHAWIREHYSPPYKFSRLIGVQLSYDHPDHYDGVSFWRCPSCAHDWPRFREDS